MKRILFILVIIAALASFQFDVEKIALTKGIDFEEKPKNSTFARDIKNELSSRPTKPC